MRIPNWAVLSATATATVRRKLAKIYKNQSKVTHERAHAMATGHKWNAKCMITIYDRPSVTAFRLNETIFDGMLKINIDDFCGCRAQIGSAAVNSMRSEQISQVNFDSREMHHLSRISALSARTYQTKSHHRAALYSVIKSEKWFVQLFNWSVSRTSPNACKEKSGKMQVNGEENRNNTSATNTKRKHTPTRENKS